MKEIGWGIVGLGNIAHSFAADFQFSTGGKLVAAASRSLSSAQSFCQEYGIKHAYGSYDELMEDPLVDVVYIATPHHLHHQNTIDAIQSGKAVVCEKPITTNAEDCKNLIKVAKHADQYLMEAMWTYFLPAVRKALEWINEGKIGRLKHIKADFGFKAPYDANGRLFNPKLAGGALLDIGIYPIALTWLIMRQKPIRMQVDAKHAPTGVDTEEKMLFEFQDGVRAELSASLSHSFPNDAIIIGTQGQIRLPKFYMAKECLLYRNEKLIDRCFDESDAIGYNCEVNAVNRDLLEGRKESEIMPLGFSLQLQQIMDEVKRNF
jgi:dihydrodiol dehydrogenase / D-xylose 1-dehydrogenase (NADP)